MELTVILGLQFSILQLFEYELRNFSINDSNYARIFFIATGFHGLHVLIGTTYNYTAGVIQNNYRNHSHLSLEFSIWY